MNKRGQVSVFVIIAIVIVVGIVLFFAARNGVFTGSVPAEFREIYVLYDLCIEEETKTALDIMGTQGGRIDVGEFAPGSDFAPFSSHLNFLGFPIPFWYYVAGNGIIEENVPSRSGMEREVESFLEERLNTNCDFSEFYARGFYVDLEEEVSADVSIEDEIVSVKVQADIVSNIEDRSARKTLHEVEVASQIGKFYGFARSIYDKQASDVFLEEYAVDVLRLNAPVDGVEVSCSPKVWKTQEVVDELKESLEANFGAIKFEGNYYNLDEETDEYFVVELDQNIENNVRILYSKDWPSRVEITPSEGDLLVAEAAADGAGTSAAGFCYTPYHFVYDVSVPALIQISDGFEIFQFPIVVIIENNQPREVELSSGFIEEEPEFDICDFAEKDVRVSVFDNNLQPVEASVEYKCFESVCTLGETEILGSEARIEAKAPSCLNGYLVVNADGFSEKTQLFSSNSESVSDVILDREYEIDVELRISGRLVEDESAIVHFAKEDGDVESAIFPEKTSVVLSEGSYELEVFVYGDSDVVVPATSKVECVEIARGGIFGLFGSTREECFDIEVPELKIEFALNGGGSLNTYILESELEKGRVVIDVDELPRPDSLEQLQYNQEAFDTLRASLVFE